MFHTISIGVNKYLDSAISDLAYARADAETFHGFFAKQLNEDQCRSRILVDEEATKSNIERLIGDELPRVVGEGDVVSLFFAGHGSPESKSSPDQVSRYLVAHDTDFDAIYSTGIDMELDLRRMLERVTRAAMVVCFLDCCFSGRAGGRTFEGPNLAVNQIRNSRIELNKLDFGEGRVIMSACDDDELAIENSQLKHGLFTSCLVETLSRRDSENEFISIGQLYDDVSQAVRSQSNGRQSPVLNGRIQGGNFPLFN